MVSDQQHEALEQVGELLITGIAGTSLAPETARWIREARVGGVIYFKSNYENPTQILALSESIQNSRTGELPLWITVDHEGGRVQRFKSPFTLLPPASKLAQSTTISGGDRSIQKLFEISQMVARELAAVGVNVNYSPVADILTEPSNPVIGDRAFGETEMEVSQCVSAWVRGHLTGGVHPCAKHFPGHGDTRQDSHFALPRVDTALEVLETREFKPFVKASKSKCRWIMTAHIILSAIDSERPATLSQKVITDILRGKLRYDGLIISDDMEMRAISDHFGAAEAPRMAVEAGCDLLIYRTEAGARAAHAALSDAIRKGDLLAERVLESVRRSRSLKEGLSELSDPSKKLSLEKIGCAEHVALAKS